MKLLVKRGRFYKIIENCWYDRKYEIYCREITKRNYDGREYLDDSKILGEIKNNGKLEPFLPYTFPPHKTQEIAKELNLEIEKNSEIQGGAGCKLYYWNGKYRKAGDLFS